MALKITNELTASRVFKSLAKDSRPWNLTRILHSDNPADLQGELQGTASFRPRRNADELLYDEAGSMASPSGTMVGMRWSRKYIWRLLSSTMQAEPELENATPNDADVGVWFVKLTKRPLEGTEDNDDDEEEPDYLFHTLDFHSTREPDSKTPPPVSNDSTTLIPPPVSDCSTKVISAHGHHLCVNDIYETTYVFRIVDNDVGGIVSWACRHIVRGPKKNQNITNLYTRNLPARGV